MRLRSVLAGGLALVTLLLSACGGSGSGDGEAQVRLINMSASTSLDLYDNNDVLISSVAPSTVSGYAGIGDGTYTANFKTAGSSTTLLSQTRAWSKDTNYTLLAYERYGAIQAVQISENQGAPTAGAGSVNFYNLATDAGAIDVYVTPTSATSLSGLSAAASTTSTSPASGYKEFTAGTYSIWIVASGSKTDVRLKIDSVTLADQQVATLALLPTTGGVLVDGVLSTQDGSVAFYRNTNARVRVVAAVSNGAIVSATAGSTTLTSALQSYQVGSYVQVPAGTQTVTVNSNGAGISSTSQTLVAGYDYTLLAYGDATATPQAVLLTDDNRISDASSSYAKVRLVHAMLGFESSPLTLYVDGQQEATSVSYGSASDYYNAQPATATAQIKVLSPSSVVYSNTDGSTFKAGATYTVFMLGTAASPYPLPVQDH